MSMKEIDLTQNKKAIVDNDLFFYLSQFKWHVSRLKQYKMVRWYASRGVKDINGNNRSERMHWHVIGKPLPGFAVDHINGNTLDNRRINLRIVPWRINCQNTNRNRDNNLVGASYDKARKKWISYIQLNGNAKYLGRFNSREEAHSRYMEECENVVAIPCP